MSEEGSIEASLTELHNGYLYLEKEHLIGRTPTDPLRLGGGESVDGSWGPGQAARQSKKKSAVRGIEGFAFQRQFYKKSAAF